MSVVQKTPVVDAHQHFWQLSQPFNYAWLDAPLMAPIRRDYLPEDLQPHLAACGVDYSIFVQTQHNVAENRWALELAERHPYVTGVVGWIDLASTDCERQLLEFRQFPKFVGVRHITQDEPDDDFIIREPIVRGLAVLEKHGVPFDLLFYERHLRHAATLARQLPELPVVIDHLAKPRIRDLHFDDWLAHLRAASAFPNVYCKLSGLVTEADWQCWTPEDLRPYVHAAIDCFGPSRLMFGSDWPVCELAAPYERVYQTLLELVTQLSGNEQSQIMGGTAIEFYGLHGQLPGGNQIHRR